MSKRWVAGTVVLFLIAGLGVVAAPARGAEPTRCLAEFDVTISPGLSSSPSSGTYTTEGETGTITCEGPINGYRPTGAGRRGEHGTYGLTDPDTCASGGEGTQVLSLTIPTTGGDQHVTDEGIFTYGPLEGGGAYGGSFRGKRMRSTFQVTPVEGDCVTTPVTRVRVRCEEWFLPER
jgi:hypothetical protein